MLRTRLRARQTLNSVGLRLATRKETTTSINLVVSGSSPRAITSVEEDLRARLQSALQRVSVVPLFMRCVTRSETRGSGKGVLAAEATSDGSDGT